MLFAVAVGVVLTLSPFVLPISWHGIPMFLHWPMLLFDRPNGNWLPLNAGKRLIVLFVVNVSGWALSLVIFWIVGGMVVRKSKVYREELIHGD